ncbi:MAG: V4R domain-containing protein [Candidatus Bathyarchaeia archaeon]
MKEALEQNNGFFVDFQMLIEMEDALQQVFASGAFVIIATMAKPCGRWLFKNFMAKSASVKGALEKFSELMSRRNWGESSFSEVDFKYGAGRIAVRNCFESRKRVGADKPCCHFLTNFVAGFLSELFAKNITVVEAECAAKGDEMCEFKFHP